MDPHTGEVLALVGGRNYGVSQLNHAVAKRPTGSIFKPFVYAAAMNTALDGTNPVFTPAIDGHRCAQHVRLWRSDLRAAQLQRGIPRRRDRSLRAGNVAEQRDRKAGGRSGLRQSGRSGKGGRNRFGESHAGHGTGRLRCHSDGHGGGLHRFRQWRSAYLAHRGQLGAERQRRHRPGFQAGTAPGARSSRGLPHDQHDGRRDEFRHGLSRSASAVSRLRRPERRAVRTTAGLPDIPATCCASSGWDTTTTAIFA